MSGNYVAELLKPHTLARLERLLHQPGHFIHVRVLHDDWCARFRGRPCDCNADVVIEVDPGEKGAA